MFGTKLTPAEKAAKDARKAREKAERRRAAEAAAARREEERQERLENMGHFLVREVREVRVKADNMQDAIALAAAAFKEGQSSDYSIKWGKPFGVEGDTVEPIRVVNVKAVED